MGLTLAWDRLDRAAWEDLFATAPRSTLVQGWAWGEVKRAAGWTPRRAVIARDGTPVALAQVLEKRLGPVRLARLNRGPVWLAGAEDPALRLAAVALVRRRWRLWRAAALALAPELPAGTSLKLARRRGADPWRSAWLDLTEPAEVLRKRLDGKWRNMLNAAERAGLTLESGPEHLPWLLDNYRALLAERGFAATPPEQIEALAAHAYRPDDLLVLRARAGDEAVAGILLARHGGCATYLIGWSGEAGRKTKATNFLLWRAVGELAGRGVTALDLGGIDDRLTPGVAAFKRGMNGAEYCLAGEFIAL